MVQFYTDDGVLLDTLAGFIGGGLQSGENAIVIATHEHLQLVDARLRAAGVDLDTELAQDHYVFLDAQEALAGFVVNGWPDDDLFATFVDGILERASDSGRRVRVFGEMVALLWARGDTAATVRLEYLWHQVCSTEQFSLFCAYPKDGFTGDPATSMREICAVPSQFIS